MVHYNPMMKTPLTTKKQKLCLAIINNQNSKKKQSIHIGRKNINIEQSIFIFFTFNKQNQNWTSEEVLGNPLQYKITLWYELFILSMH